MTTSQTLPHAGPEIDPRRFREVLGHYPTGVSLVTAVSATGEPTGMAVGSFASVSLDPPLITFLPDRTSSTFPLIRDAQRFCVNVLSSAQEQLCRTFATRGLDRFDGVSWEPAPYSGAPRLTGSVAWVDCEVDVVHEAGDHFIVVGRVHDLGVDNPTSPLLFFQGGYGMFALPSLVVASREGNTEHVRLAELAREPMERLTRSVGLECRALAADGDRLVVVATAGAATGADPVGGMIPFAPPFGSSLVAWAGQDVVDAWLRGCSGAEDPAIRANLEADLARLRGDGWYLASDARTRAGDELAREISRWGWTPRLEKCLHELGKSVGRLLGPHDLTDANAHEVQMVSVPVFDSGGQAVLQLTLYGFPTTSTRTSILHAKDRLMRASAEVTAKLG